MMYLKFIWGQFKVFIMIVIAFLIFPFVTYPKRRKIWEMRNELIKRWYFWFADSSERDFGTDEKNYLNSVYGIYELVEDENGDADYEKFETFGKLRLFFLAYNWMVFRNGAWNYIASIKPKNTNITDMRCLKLIGNAECTVVRNQKIFGLQKKQDGLIY